MTTEVLVREPQVSNEAPRDYAWAHYLDFMEGGAPDVLEPPGEVKYHWFWGVFVSVVISVIAMWMGELPFWPFTMSRGRHPIEPVMLSILLGMLVSNIWKLPAALQPGIKFSVKRLLPIAIVLLGARLNFSSVLQIGLSGIMLSILEIILALSLLAFLSKKFQLPQKLGLLLGVGTAICGGTAIVAIAPVVEAEEKDVVFSVATVTLLGLILMFILPVLASVMGMTEKAFGIWAGLSIHQTPQVIAAGFAYGSVAGETATIAKLSRVCLLAPVAFVIGLRYARTKASAASQAISGWKYLQLFPMFVLGFLAMALLRTMGLLPDVTFHMANTTLFKSPEHTLSLVNAADWLSKVLIVVSMTGVGLETKASAMRQTGLKPLLASLIAVVVISALLLLLIRLTIQG